MVTFTSSRSPALVIGSCAAPRAWALSVLWFACGILVVYALFSVPRKVFELSLSEQSQTLATLVSAAVAAAAALVCWRYNGWIARVFQQIAAHLSRVDPRWWMALVIGVGILIRIAWVAFFPTVQTSDHATYVVLAKKLLAGQPYFDGDSYSNWPPGLPFFLAANFALFGDSPLVIVGANLGLYAISVFLVYRLGHLVAGEPTARIATLLLLLWPNDIMCTGLAKKELLILPLLTGGIVAFVAAHRTDDTAKQLWLLAAAGALLGAASLTQPSLVLLPTALAVYEFARGATMPKLLLRFGVVVAAMCIVILPWSIRNYIVLGAVVPISTAGGDGFYSANNGLATGRYIPVYERSLEPFDEVTRSKMGYRWGLEWVSEHPRQFLGLTINRQIHILGEDSDGAYWGLKVGGGRDGVVYLLAKGLSNAYWMAIMFLILAAVLAHWPDRIAWPPDIVLLMLTLFYVVAIDSVFQSGSRHHMPLMGVLSVLAALIACGRHDQIASPRA